MKNNDNIAIKVLKRIIFAFIFIYLANYIVFSYNIVIPINVYTLSTVSLLGIPGIISLIGVLIFI